MRDPKDPSLAPVVDLHVDTLLRYLELVDPGPAKDNWPQLHVDADRCRRGGVRLLLTACYTGDREVEPAAKVERMLDAVDRLHGDPGSPFRRVHGPRQFSELRAGEIGLLPTIENARSLEGDVSRLAHWHARGVRVTGVTWNGPNELAAGVLADPWTGFTALGRDFLVEARRCQLAIDVSHLSPAGVDDVLDSAPHAVLATHSNAAAVCEHPRNLTDAQLRRLRDANGLVGLNFYPPFLSRRGAADLGDVVRHALHLADVVGVDRIALGTDLDGIDQLPADFEGYQDLPRLVRALAASGFRPSEIEGILGANFLRWWQNWSSE